LGKEDEDVNVGIPLSQVSFLKEPWTSASRPLNLSRTFDTTLFTFSLSSVVGLILLKTSLRFKGSHF
jgi:hypothetical protein